MSKLVRIGEDEYELLREFAFHKRMKMIDVINLAILIITKKENK